MQNFTLNDQNQALNSFKLYSLITTRGSYLSVTRRAKTLYRCQLKAIVPQADCMFLVFTTRVAICTCRIVLSQENKTHN